MSQDFARFDARGYRTLEVVEGYAAWAPLYDRRPPDIIDMPLLERLGAVPWRDLGAVVDLACGTGRIGAWMTARGVAAIDGVDCSAPMLERARGRGCYRRLAEADLGGTGLDSQAYDLAICALAVCHLPSLAPFYAEAARLVRPGGMLAVIDMHPFFLMSGIPTHFDSPAGEPIAVRNHVHLFSDHTRAALSTTWSLAETHERLVDDEWVRLAPGMAKHGGRPIGLALVWRR
jgi:SAM-dependent methyltransferase